jgi:adenylosuccinate lyase
LNLYLDVASGLAVNPRVIRASLDAELPFLASEALMMAAVRQGLDRQDVHESLRRASHAAAQAMKDEGVANPLRDLIARDPVLGPLAPRLDEVLDGSKHVGRAPEQVLEFVAEEVDPLLDRHRGLLGVKSEVRV